MSYVQYESGSKRADYCISFYCDLLPEFNHQIDMVGCGWKI